jgi:hypothetical protein
MTFEAIDPSALESVTGGDGQPNTSKRSVNFGLVAPTPRGPLQLGLQGNQENNNYATCAETVRRMGGKPADLRIACGLPWGGP